MAVRGDPAEPQPDRGDGQVRRDPSVTGDIDGSVVHDWSGVEMAAQRRPMGVEEEFFLLDPESSHLLPVADRVIGRWQGRNRAGPGQTAAEPGFQRELFQEQIEMATPPCRSREQLQASLVGGRRLLAASARAESALLMATGLSIVALTEGTLSRDERYARIVDIYGRAAQTLMCATQVHVEVVSPVEGARVVEGMRPWFPFLVALTANSPVHEEQDTGHDSWRSRLREMWPSTGFPQAVGGPDDYARLERRLLEWGVAQDVGTINFAARISDRYPTVEIRVADACTDVRDAVLLAVLVRAMVDALSHDAQKAQPAPPWLDAELRAAHWRAGRYGLSGPLVHPVEQVLSPSTAICEYLTQWLGEALECNEDLDFVSSQLDRLLREGNGAEQQRRVLRRTGSAVQVARDAASRSVPSD